MADSRLADSVLERRLRQQALVAELGERALTTPELDEFLNDAARLIANHLDVEFVKILQRLPGSQELLLRAGYGWHEGLVGSAILPGGLDSQAGYALASDQPVMVEDLASERRFHSAQLLLDHDVVSGISVLIRGPRKSFGVVGAHTRERRTFTQDDGNFLQAVANVLGAAIHLRQHASAQDLLSEATALLSNSLEYEETLRAFAQLLVRRMADWAAVHLVDDDGNVRELEIAHRDPRLVERVRRLRRDYGEARGTRQGLQNVIRTGQPEVYSTIPSGTLETQARDAEHRELLEILAIRSALLLPMVARGRTIGVIEMVSSHPQHRYGHEDITLGMELASRAAFAVDNARNYRLAQETADVREAFLSSVSHELRTPLTSVLGYSYRLSRRADQFDEQTRADIETLAAEARRMRTTLDTLLNLADLESGRVELAPEPVELRHLLDEEVQAMLRRFPSVRVDRVYPDGPHIALTDPDRIRQIVGNLLDNAAKHGGPAPHITLTLTAEDRRTTIAVRDRGPGVAPELRSSIFGRFVRGESSRKVRGMGLGLYLSQLIAARLHADLILREPVGGGAEFVVRLPLTREVLLNED